MTIKVKRVYDPPSPDDGYRVLVDRLWPRGISKENAKIDAWFKEIAPSNELRKWYGHEHSKWQEFKEKYFAELAQNQQAFNKFKTEIKKDAVTFLFSSKEPKLNNAYALKEYLGEDN